MKQYIKDFIHNVIVHPLMMFLPAEVATRMHDKNAAWAFGAHRIDELKYEGKK